MTIRILNDDMPGVFQFDKRGYFVRESCGEALLIIQREDGADGDIELTCVTTPKTAVDGKDYVGGTYKVKFRHGETSKFLKIPIIDDMSAMDKEETFLVEIVGTDCEGAEIGSRSHTMVTIANDENFNNLVDNMMNLTEDNLSDLSIYRSSWSDHIKVVEQHCFLFE